MACKQLREPDSFLNARITIERYQTACCLQCKSHDKPPSGLRVFL